jgi:lipopolysaccharide biosynthesis glycosyltransferase
MSTELVIVLAADQKYFSFLQGCLASIRDKPQGRSAKLAFFDLGCTPEQLSWIRQHVDIIKQPEWEFDFAGRDHAPQYARGMLARPFLRKYFPDFECYVWLDVDAWVQDWSAIELLLAGARKRRGLAIVPEVDRGSRLQYGLLPSYWRKVASWYSASFGDEVAKEFCSFPLLNAGVFAMHHQALHWDVWKQTLETALQRNCGLISDQMALNYAVYGQELFDKTEMLPSWCNWTCHFGWPAWDPGRSKFVEPYLPHREIGIIHFTEKKLTQKVLRTIDGNEVNVSVLYPAGVANC